MNTSIRKSLRNRLVRRDGTLCHYCEEPMSFPTGCSTNPHDMTLEHVVPQSYGGSDDLSNLVLACSDCNNVRGNELNFCWCDRCDRVITNFFNKKFLALMNANKPRIGKHNGTWRVRQGRRARHFKTWNAAIRFALEGMQE